MIFISKFNQSIYYSLIIWKLFEYYYAINEMAKIILFDYTNDEIVAILNKKDGYKYV